MATGIIHANKASPSFVCNENVFCDLQCKSCSSMKGDIQVLVNEMKSMTEIISILKEELKHHDAASRERRTISTCGAIPTCCCAIGTVIRDSWTTDTRDAKLSVESGDSPMLCANEDSGANMEPMTFEHSVTN